MKEMDKTEKNKLRINKKRKIGIMLLVMFFISNLNFSMSNTSGKSILPMSDFSEQLEYEPYINQDNVGGWYDGIETFFDDTIGNEPIYWSIYEPAWITIDIVNDGAHKSVLRIFDETGSDLGKATYYFKEGILYSDTYSIPYPSIQFSFWCKFRL